MNAAVSEISSEAAATAERLKITEVFLSLQGEARQAGWPTVFVRLTGCPLRCQYCDTAYAFHGGEWRTIDEILAEVARQGVRHVCVTGGEPLAQKRCITLLQRLEKKGYVASDKSGFAYVFRPAVTREEVMHARLTELADELCDGDPAPLVLAFAQQHRFTPEEIEQFRKLIENLEAKRRRTTR